ncbi:MAG: hypothetical protein F6K50_53655, partial [Moorea sp. SIO3I7]|nr:hypothetical protein [Moorena sp. SIO3I7]
MISLISSISNYIVYSKIIEYSLPIPDSRFPIPYYPLPITHYPLPITHYPLPITR